MAIHYYTVILGIASPFIAVFRDMITSSNEAVNASKFGRASAKASLVAHDLSGLSRSLLILFNRPLYCSLEQTPF